MTGEATTSRRSVVVGLAAAVAQTVALGGAAAATGSVALRTQTVTNLADVAVGVFLLLGVLRSARPADDHHPLGSGREQFFWSFVAAAGIFVGGVGAATAETVRAVADPQPTGSYPVGYAVLAVVVGLDAVALVVAARPLARRAASQDRPLLALLWRGTDPAASTVLLSSAAGLVGGVVAAVGLALRELTGHPGADAAASAVIAAVLLGTSLLLLHTSRELLTGRGVPPTLVARMRAVVAAGTGVVDVPDLFAVVVGPQRLLVAGDVVFDDALDVPAVEAALVAAAASLRVAWPSVASVYLNPVESHRARDGAPTAHPHPTTRRPSRWPTWSRAAPRTRLSSDPPARSVPPGAPS